MASPCIDVIKFINITDTDIPQVAQIINERKASTVDLSGNSLDSDKEPSEITATGLSELALLLKDNRTIQKLKLDNNIIRVDGGKAIASFFPIKNLQEISAKFCRMECNSAEAIAAGLIQYQKQHDPDMTFPKRLNFSGNFFEAKGGTALANALNENAPLSRLDLSFNNISAAAITEIFAALSKVDKL